MNIPPLSIFIFNSIEDEWNLTSSIQNSYLLSDSYLFMNVFIPQSILITPIEISAQFKEYVENLANVTISSYSPIHKTHSICKNIIADKKLFATLIYEAKKCNNTIELKAYVSTPELHLLREAFIKKGVRVLLPENTAKQHLWTVDFFGSKAGFRSVFSRYMPQGYICYSIQEALEKIQEIYRRTKAVVIKTNKGCSGQGTIIVKNKKAPHFASLLSRQSYWKKNPIVVEECIDTSKEKQSQFPSIEGFITEKGGVVLPYYCNMIVTKEGEFYGIEMHKKVVNEKVRKEMIEITMYIGKIYAEAGYRGRFDVDFLFDGKRLYANESNTRTNGGTDTYFIARKLLGSSFFTSRYVLNDYIDLKNKLSFDAFMHLLSPLLYDKKTKTGLILGSENALRHKGLSVTIIGRNINHTNSLMKKMNILLKSILTNKKNS